MGEDAEVCLPEVFILVLIVRATSMLLSICVLCLVHSFMAGTFKSFLDQRNRGGQYPLKWSEASETVLCTLSPG